MSARCRPPSAGAHRCRVKPGVSACDGTTQRRPGTKARAAHSRSPQSNSSGANTKRNGNEEAHLRPRCGNVARSRVTRSTSQCAAGSPYPQRIGFRGRRECTLSLRSAKGLHRTHRRHARLSWTPRRQARSRLPGKVKLTMPSAHQRTASHHIAVRLTPPAPRSSDNYTP